ncbi:MAG: sigma-70 family RNA polymerase sigma factor, partial [Chloroflexota bacterium]
MRFNPDSQLIEAACAGEPEAIDQLLLQVQPAMLRFARQYCATPQDVEDAVQQGLWIIYQKIERLHTATAFVSWIFTIVRNECHRLLKRARHVDDQAQWSDFAAESGEIDADLRHDLAVAIARLPVSYRQVLIMRDIEGRTAPETAAALGITLDTVKGRLSRARN